MSNKTNASSIGGSKPFNRLIFPLVDRSFGSNVSSTANLASAVYIEIRHPVTVQAIGMKVGTCINGNAQLGLYNSTFNLVCSTATFAVAGLTNWIYKLTTTNPTLTPGIYWIAVVSDTNYVAATSGLQYTRTSAIFVDLVDSVNLGHQIYLRMDAAYPLPAVFVPVDNDNTLEIALILKVTIP